MSSSISGGRLRRVLVATAAVMLVAVLPVSAAAARPNDRACEIRNNNTYSKLLECVRVDQVREHQAAFQAIADANGGTRAAGTPGYDASVDYVVDTLEAAGWTVTLDEFDFEFFPPATLQQLTPVNAVYETGAFTNTGDGTVTGPVIPVDINLVPPRASTSGCEATDFAGLNFGGMNDIALIQRGTCTFAAKALNAQAAGAEAVIIFNQGNDPTREGLIVGTLDPAVLDIPVVGASFANGEALAQAGSTALVNVDPPENRPQVNVIAELPGNNNDNVVMAGAHLDSVQAGPGINDNGSGSAALLEVAQQIAKIRPENTLRFAWWAAEESGLLGSEAYVAGLSQAEKDRIALYLNFDMVGSPNYVFMIYDGDQSGFPAPPGVPIPEGSVQIEDLFESYFTLAGEPYDDAQFSGRSDYQAFILNGIPASGLFTGAEVRKTAEQAAIWGGTVGDQFDPCYHLACDMYDNVAEHALDVNSDAIAFVVLTYAMSTETVNGVPGRKVPGRFDIPAPAGPEGTGAGGGFQAAEPS
jgi:Zn-dependent M28 family amino/carboxypeptidase